jgi:hypothetical protein
MVISGLLILDETIYGLALDDLKLFLFTTISGFATLPLLTISWFRSFLSRNLYRRKVASNLFI